MKQKFLIIFMLLFCLSVSAQKKPTDREIEGLKGNVKTAFEDYNITKVSSGPTEINKRVKWQEYYFDKDGMLTLLVYPSHNFKYIYSIIDGFKTFKDIKIKEETADKMTFTRVLDEEEEKPIEEPEKLVEPDERFTMKYTYEYDAQGKITTERHYGNNGELWRLTKYKYDEKGRVIEEIKKEKGSTTKYIYKYDEKGNLIENSEEYNRTNGYVSKAKTVYSDYKLDANGNWVARKEIYSSKSSSKTYSDSFDKTTISYRTISYY